MAPTIRRRRTLSEAKRSFLRRLETVSTYEVGRIADEVRRYAIARAFFSGESVEWLAGSSDLCQAFDRSDVETAIRRQGRPRRFR